MRPNPDWPTRLLAWFAREGRELPWREQRTAYTTWVSEVMLQQTRVEAVRPYYAAWLHRFPTPAAVAAADESEILHAWQGLGYYRRAQYLQRAMREVVARYSGEIPADPDALAALPGVGPYMLGAIRSLAFGEAVPAVDGNVLRVFARLYGIEDDVLRASTRTRVTALAQEVIPAEAPGAFNEALMDLGATVCTPRTPRCAACPLRDDCVASKTGRETVLPRREKKTKQVIERVAVAVIADGGRYLLHRRSATGMLANMWEFPSVTGTTLAEATARLCEARGLSKPHHVYWRHRHIFTHRIWEMRAYRWETALTPQADERWWTRAELLTIPLAGPHARLAAILE